MKDLWTFVNNITSRGDYLVFHTKQGLFHVYNDGRTTKTTEPGGPTPQKPWAKYFRYDTVDNKNIITYVENRTVDIIPLSPDHQQVYLIKRADKNGIPGGIALPGGHIDPPESPMEAAYRELSEEVLAGFDAKHVVSEFVQYGNWVNELVMPGKKSAELVSITLPFKAVMKPGITMTPGDDAVSGRWYYYNKIPWTEFHFYHHIEILKSFFGI